MKNLLTAYFYYTGNPHIENFPSQCPQYPFELSSLVEKLMEDVVLPYDVHLSQTLLYKKSNLQRSMQI